MSVMEKKRKKPYPSRLGIKYLPIPVALWQRLKKLGEKDDRSVSYMGRKAVTDYCDRAEMEVDHG